MKAEFQKIIEMVEKGVPAKTIREDLGIKTITSLRRMYYDALVEAGKIEEIVTVNRRKTEVELICQQCNTSFQIPQSLAKNRRFCSNTCYWNFKKEKSKTNRISENCLVCGKEFSVSKNKKFCSNTCWKDFRREIAKNKRIKKNCLICGKRFSVKPSLEDLSKTCSVKCQTEWQRRKRIYKQCLFCKKTFFVRPSEDYTFCSIECYRKYKGLKSWTKKKIRKTIRSLQREGADLNAAYVRDKYLSLFKAAIKHYGSWEMAIEESGLEYEKIREDRKVASYKGIIVQDAVKVLYKKSGIKIREKPYLAFGEESCVPDFLEINKDLWVDVKLNSFSSGIEKSIEKYLKYTDKLLILYLSGNKRKWKNGNVTFTNIFEYFPILDSNDAEIREIRHKLRIVKDQYDLYPYDLETMSRKWSKEKIIHSILSLNKKGKSLSTSSIQKSNSRLYRSACKYFEGWEEALTAAGLDYSKIWKKIPKYERDNTLEEIKALYKSGADLSYSGLRNNNRSDIYHAGRKLFGSWPKALKAAGIKPEEFRKPTKTPTWTKEAILERIKLFHRTGQSLVFSDIKQFDTALLSSARRYFGSWEAALTSAGFDYSKIRRKERWSKERIILKIISLSKSGADLSYSGLKKIGEDKLCVAGTMYFGSWENALKVAGLDYGNISWKKLPK